MFIEKILPKTDPYVDAVDVGDWVKREDVWVPLSGYEVTGVSLDAWAKCLGG
jgi:hypothetical protein